jgi:hypothetical protein
MQYQRILLANAIKIVQRLAAGDEIVFGERLEEVRCISGG